IRVRSTSKYARLGVGTSMFSIRWASSRSLSSSSASLIGSPFRSQCQVKDGTQRAPSMLELTVESVVGNALCLGCFPDRGAEPIHHEDGRTLRFRQPRQSLDSRITLHELLGDV